MARRSAAFAAALVLAACHSRPIAAPPDAARDPGRYAGLGVFDAGRLWSEIRREAPPHDRALATLADDEHVIVTLDSRSGEIRQCGDHSGYCVAMDPWAGSAGSVAGHTLRLARHAAEAAAADRAAAAENISVPLRP